MKVYECAVWGECVLGRIVDGLTSCVLCPQYNPIADAASPTGLTADISVDNSKAPQEPD